MKHQIQDKLQYGILVGFENIGYETDFNSQRYVIDWHNLGYSLLKVHKVPNIIIKISKYLEIFFGRFADGHITVTKSLQEFLLNENIQSTVVYDRPSPLFRYCPELRTRYSEELNINSEDIWVITSTSWTPDEDINILLTASDYLEEILEGNSRSLSFIITGIGPGRRSFESEVKGRNYRNISFYFEFLQYEKYAELLGTCDVGVSLHKSSSGIDLPMKGLDMIGAGLPLLSIEYQSIRELVEEGENGLLFNDGKELSEIIRKLFVSNEISIEGLREGSIKSGRKKWTEEWNLHAKGVFFVKD
ncbi:chitobiosyldiphosphodolichol beta-mannosyltransferase-like [Histomonas meleagridis]|nr:chitobiosyldiphosphodolichol beta-mannosyltransferase-like [Histomonas meleagridis]